MQSRNRIEDVQIVEHIDALNQEADRLRKQNPAEALQMSLKAKDAAEQAGYSTGLAESMLIIASAKWQIGQFNEVETYASQALQIFERLGNKLRQAHALQALGLAYRKKGLIDKALQTLQETLRLAREIENKELQANASNNLGAVYGILADYATAAGLITESIELYRELRDTLGEAAALSNFALIASLNNDYEQAIKLYQEALAHFQAANSKLNIARSTLNIGGIYLKQQKPDLALSYSREALALFESLGHVGAIGITKHNIAMALIEKGEMQEARRALMECLHRSEETGDKFLNCSVSLNLGRIYVKWQRLS